MKFSYCTVPLFYGIPSYGSIMLRFVPTSRVLGVSLSASSRSAFSKFILTLIFLMLLLQLAQR